MLNLNKLLIGAGVLASLALQSAGASEVTLRLHQFLPQTSSVPAMAITPWIEKVEKESGGRIKVQHFPLMQAGGTPAQLFDQARDGVVDIVWTAPGYTPGRFPRSEVFELPFMLNKNAEKSSVAFHEYVTTHAMEEFKDVRLKSGGKKVEQLKASGASVLACPCENCRLQIEELNEVHGLGLEVWQVIDLVVAAMPFKATPEADAATM